MNEIRQQRQGYILACIAASSLAVITTFARLMFDAGATPLTVITVRAAFGALILFMIARWIDGPFTLPRAAVWPLVFAGMGLTMITFGYMSSVFYIPVGLAALIFYTFPLVVLAVEAIRDRRPPGPRRIATFLAAFAGLGLTLGPSLKTIDPIGVLCAFIGGLGAALFLFAGKAAGRHLKPLTIATYANLILLPIALLVILAGGNFTLPQTELGCWALVGAGTAYMIGLSAQVASVRFADTGTVSLIHNIEPVISIAVAWALLGETLSGTQLVGVALVIAAISAGTRLSKEL